MFQEVVAIIHEHMAGAATIDESAMLVNRLTGEEREVDVVIRSCIAGQEMVLGIEATTQKGSSPWTESMIAKHAELPTDRLVLVAEKGFSKPARRYAAMKGVALIEPITITAADPAFKVVNQLERMWPKGVALTPESAWMRVRKPDGTYIAVRDVPLDALIMTANEREVGTPASILKDMMDHHFDKIAEEIGLADITEDLDQFFVMGLGTIDQPLGLVRSGATIPVYARWEADDPPELHQVIQLEFRGRAVINVAEVALTHRRFDKSNVAYGRTAWAGREATFVVTENEAGGKMTVRIGRETTAEDGERARVSRSEDSSGTDP
jgi:hypothetical protein